MVKRCISTRRKRLMENGRRKLIFSWRGYCQSGCSREMKKRHRKLCRFKKTVTLWFYHKRAFYPFPLVKPPLINSCHIRQYQRRLPHSRLMQPESVTNLRTWRFYNCPSPPTFAAPFYSNWQIQSIPARINTTPLDGLFAQKRKDSVDGQ